ncbi:MAG: tripartite tricarboxylate transporter permease [SAR324 cluster bacterium]|nr:tripartite tricarboxylate transporter permease [SAR324 cluster bacterium]
MELLGHLYDGFTVTLTPFNLTMLVLGVSVGLFVGAMPGLGSVNGVAILLPATFAIGEASPTSAIIFLCALYYGAMYGGAISSIMLGIPGASTAVATTFDGRPMAIKGEAEKALIAAAAASFFGGTVSVILFTLFAPPLADFALRFGPPEEFALMVMAFATFVGLGSESILKTLFAIAFGLVLSSVGLDIISGRPRLIFGEFTGFMHGINFLVLAIGIYGIGEILWTIESTKGKVTVSQAKVTLRSIVTTVKSLRSCIGTMTFGALLGYFVGILPAAGATPGSLMAYGMAKNFSKTPEKFGTGIVEGVVAPEAANNAASTGSMLPMLTLGIPGSPTTAILLGGMIIWGLTPGPNLFVEEEEFVWGLISSLYVANAAALVLNIAFIPLFMTVLRLPFTILAPIIFVLCVVGGYAPTTTMHDVWLMLIFGLGGYLLRKLEYPVAPIVLAIVLGPLAEQSMRQSLIMALGSPVIFFERPLSLMFMIFAVMLFILPRAKKLFAVRNKNKR